MAFTEEQKQLGSQLADRISNRKMTADELAAVIRETAPDLSQYDGHGTCTALGWAARFDEQELINVLLDAGADIGQQDSEGNTPLHLAVTFCRICTKLLLARGAPVHIANHEGDTPLMVAAWKNNLSALKGILELEPDLAAMNNAGQTAMDVALRASHHAAVTAINYAMPHERSKRFIAEGLPTTRLLPPRKAYASKIRIMR